METESLPPALRPPTDLIGRIFSQLDCVDLLHCSLVCKQWYRDSAELREGWKNEYLEARNLFGLCIKRETHPPSATCSIRGDSYAHINISTCVETAKSLNALFYVTLTSTCQQLNMPLVALNVLPKANG